jgi:hypothetical protein
MSVFRRMCLAAALLGLALSTQADPQSTRTPAVRTYVVATYDGASLRLYLNGRQAGWARFRGPVELNKFPIEIGSFIGGAVWKGTIDEAAIYGDAVSASVIRRRYALGARGLGRASYRHEVEASPGLQSYWRLDERSGPAVDRWGGRSGQYRRGVARGVAGLIADDRDAAANFSGRRGSVIVPQSRGIDVGKAFTLEAWVTGASTGDRHVLSRLNSFFLKTDPSGKWMAGLYSRGRIESVVEGASGEAGSRRKVDTPSVGMTDVFLAVMIAVAAGSLAWILVDSRRPQPTRTPRAAQRRRRA